MNALAQSDRETEFVACLLEVAHKAGICYNETDLVNFYVALKSKPMVILTGPYGGGKIAAVQCLSRILLGDCGRCQMLSGHPWAYEKSENIAMFTEVYTRYTSEKLRCLIEEAWLPENTHRIFIACITHISPAELLSFFTEIAFQLRHGRLMRFGDIHFSKPILFPPNLYLVGTMDTPDFNWWDPDLLSMTTVIQWPVVGTLTPVENGSVSYWEGGFLQSRVRDKQSAYHKVHSILKREKQPFLPLLRIEALLIELAIPDLHWMMDDAVLFLANSWSRLGNGLFDLSNSRNLEIALDLVITQIILPRVADRLQEDVTLRERLLAVSISEFPRSAAFVSALA